MRSAANAVSCSPMSALTLLTLPQPLYCGVTTKAGYLMLEAIFHFAGLCAAIWLAIALVDMLVATVRREWRFSIKSMMIVTAFISLILGMLVTLARK